MHQKDIFRNARWIMPATNAPGQPSFVNFPILRRRFALKEFTEVTLKVIGFGFFHAFVNGQPACDSKFLPLNTDYETRDNYPAGETLHGHRVIVPVFDITPLVRSGDNLLAVHFGGGWYTFPLGKYGDPKVIYIIEARNGGDVEYFVSGAELSGNEPIGADASGSSSPFCEASANDARANISPDLFFDSFVKDYCLTTHEVHDYRGFDGGIFGDSAAARFGADSPNSVTAARFGADSPDSVTAAARFGADSPDSIPAARFGADSPDSIPAAACPDLDADFVFSDCPPDRIIETIKPRLISSGTRSTDGGDVPYKVYDIGRNTTGVPNIRSDAPEGAGVTVRFSEELCPDGTIDARFSHNQRFSFISDGRKRLASPLFTWFGFRYFEVSGCAEAESVDVIHADVKPSGYFRSDNETLNWIYDTFLNTQLSNMHAGIPSDCPHIERRGYTGDGELVCHAAMSSLDAREFYRKWLDDISDCQDVLTGHVQYTAPYLRSGGGPGAWGCAIVEVPYRFLKEYGDPEPARRLFPQMLRYFDFLEAHSLNDIVVSDKAGEWCLGDWCTLTETALPAGFVNNYYYIRSMVRARELALIFGYTDKAEQLSKTIDARINATVGAYYNTWDCNFLANIQGANAFAVDLGLGNRHTLDFTVNYYRKLGVFDTGICGTDVLTRVLFETGNGDLAVDLLTGEGAFTAWKKAGFTTLSEYWIGSTRDRSHSHPMFGSVVAYMFQYLLGITQPGNSYGYETLIISPFISLKAGNIEGSRNLPCGAVSVKYELAGDKVNARVTLPEAKTAEFVYKEFRRQLDPGENVFSFGI